MINLLGPRDDFLRILEEQLQADLHVRGGRITLSGGAADVAKAAEVLDELITILRTGQGLTGETVERVIQMSEDPTAAASEILTQNIVSSRGKTVRPKTLNQKRYVEAIDDNTVTFGVGPAGTGKTYLAMAKAVQALQAKEVNRIILSRPAVEAGERLGFLPGTLYEKIDPYLRPLYDALFEMLKAFAGEKGYKIGYVMWPLRTAVSGRQNTPGGATELMEVFGKEESLRRIREGIAKLSREIREA